MRHLALFIMLLCVGCATNTATDIVPRTIQPTIINCRIVIFRNIDCEQPISTKDAIELIDSSELYFSQIPIDFKVTTIEIRDYSSCSCYTDLSKDSLDYPNQCSIYFVRLNVGWIQYLEKVGNVMTAGLGSFPWFTHDRGIYIIGSYNYTKDIVGHELGHWLGLYHTFQPGGDEVSDSVDTSDPEYFNLMNYNVGLADQQFLTDGQIERIKSCIVRYRQNSVIKQRN